MVPRRKNRVVPPTCPLITCMRVLGGAWNRLTALGGRLLPAIEAIVEVGQELKRLRAVS